MEAHNPSLGTYLHDFRNRSSTPIEIPTRRRPTVPWNGSPTGYPSSPDLIFEMSPDFSSHRGLGLTATSSNLSPTEPFMYSFPKMSPRNYIKSRRLTQPLQTSRFQVDGSPLVPVIPSAITTHSSLSFPSDTDHDILTRSPAYSNIKVSKSASTTKITGFIPVTSVSAQVYSPTRPRKTRRLSPPPRSTSYSSSPWILPGKSDVRIEEECFEAEPSSLEFNRHLTRRIENRSPLRFRRMSHISSIRV